MNSDYMFKALLKAYTGDALHPAFARKLVAGKYDEIQSYLTAYIECLNLHSFKFSYQQFHEPLYRAGDPNEKFSLKNYKLNSIGMWPLF
jgi:hypothetical protein